MEEINQITERESAHPTTPHQVCDITTTIEEEQQQKNPENSVSDVSLVINIF